jgi:hypothetical protein
LSASCAARSEKRCSSAPDASFAISRAVCSGRSSTSGACSVVVPEAVGAASWPRSRVRIDPTTAANTNATSPSAISHWRDFSRDSIGAKGYYTARYARVRSQKGNRKAENFCPSLSSRATREIQIFRVGRETQIPRRFAPRNDNGELGSPDFVARNRGLRSPVGDESVGLVGRFGIAIRCPHQFLAIGTEHGEPVEAWTVGDLLQVLAVHVDGVKLEVAHPPG